MPEGLSREVIERWKGRVEEVARDAEWTAARAELDRRRRAALPEFRELLQRFFSGEVGVEALREIFDTRTRTDWDVFGLKGLSGAMVINQLVKYVPDKVELGNQLRTVLSMPSSAREADGKLRTFMHYVDRQREAEGVPAGRLQSRRAVFLASCCWHIQDPEAWPPFYLSARKGLRVDGLVPVDSDAARAYLDFREVFHALARALQLTSWQFEHVLARLHEGRAAPSGEILATPHESPDGPRTWLIAPGRGAKEWNRFYEEGIAAIGWSPLGDLHAYQSLEAVNEALRAQRNDGTNPYNDALACWEIAHVMKPGDRIFAKKGRQWIIGYGTVTSDYIYDESQKFPHIRKVKWHARGEWKPRDDNTALVMKTLTEIGRYPGLVRDIAKALQLDSIDDGDTGDDIERPAPIEYSMANAIADVFVPSDEIAQALDLLRRKKNVILQGPPGVGKTYYASRLAYLLAGAKAPEQIRRVQFHQSYAYEDFIQGFRPQEGAGFVRQDGPFLRFCAEALQDPNTPYVLLIDEINRGNVSKILGELMLLIEADKRSPEWALELAYSRPGEAAFHVPPNLHIIGTMNTADRSLAMVDYALRRRFSFIDVEPAFGSAGFQRALREQLVDEDLIQSISARMRALNERIRNDPDLRAGFQIGHSYFCEPSDGAPRDEEWFSRVVRFEIEPLLREYWFDDTGKADEAVAILIDDE